MFLSWNINDNSISPRSEHSVQVREAEREHDKRANPTPPCPDQNILHHLSSLVHSASEAIGSALLNLENNAKPQL